METLQQNKFRLCHLVVYCIFSTFINLKATHSSNKLYPNVDEEESINQSLDILEFHSNKQFLWSYLYPFSVSREKNYCKKIYNINGTAVVRNLGLNNSNEKLLNEIWVSQDGIVWEELSLQKNEKALNKEELFLKQYFKFFKIITENPFSECRKYPIIIPKYQAKAKYFDKLNFKEIHKNSCNVTNKKNNKPVRYHFDKENTSTNLFFERASLDVKNKEDLFIEFYKSSSLSDDYASEDGVVEFIINNKIYRAPLYFEKNKVFKTKSKFGKIYFSSKAQLIINAKIFKKLDNEKKECESIEIKVSKNIFFSVKTSKKSIFIFNKKLESKLHEKSQSQLKLANQNLAKFINPISVLGEKIEQRVMMNSNRSKWLKYVNRRYISAEPVYPDNTHSKIKYEKKFYQIESGYVENELDNIKNIIPEGIIKRSKLQKNKSNFHNIKKNKIYEYTFKKTSPFKEVEIIFINYSESPTRFEVIVNKNKSKSLLINKELSNIIYQPTDFALTGEYLNYAKDLTSIKHQNIAEGAAKKIDIGQLIKNIEIVCLSNCDRIRVLVRQKTNTQKKLNYSDYKKYFYGKQNRVSEIFSSLITLLKKGESIYNETAIFNSSVFSYTDYIYLSYYYPMAVNFVQKYHEKKQQFELIPLNKYMTNFYLPLQQSITNIKLFKSQVNSFILDDNIGDATKSKVLLKILIDNSDNNLLRDFLYNLLKKRYLDRDDFSSVEKILMFLFTRNLDYKYLDEVIELSHATGKTNFSYLLSLASPTSFAFKDNFYKYLEVENFNFQENNKIISSLNPNNIFDINSEVYENSDLVKKECKHCVPEFSGIATVLSIDDKRLRYYFSRKKNMTKLYIPSNSLLEINMRILKQDENQKSATLYFGNALKKKTHAMFFGDSDLLVNGDNRSLSTNNRLIIKTGDEPVSLDVWSELDDFIFNVKMMFTAENVYFSDLYFSEIEKFYKLLDNAKNKKNIDKIGSDSQKLQRICKNNRLKIKHLAVLKKENNQQDDIFLNKLCNKYSFEKIIISPKMSDAKLKEQKKQMSMGSFDIIKSINLEEPLSQNDLLTQSIKQIFEKFAKTKDKATLFLDLQKLYYQNPQLEFSSPNNRNILNKFFTWRGDSFFSHKNGYLLVRDELFGEDVDIDGSSYLKITLKSPDQSRLLIESSYFGADIKEEILSANIPELKISNQETLLNNKKFVPNLTQQKISTVLNAGEHQLFVESNNLVQDSFFKVNVYHVSKGVKRLVPLTKLIKLFVTKKNSLFSFYLENEAFVKVVYYDKYAEELSSKIIIHDGKRNVFVPVLKGQKTSYFKIYIGEIKTDEELNEINNNKPLSSSERSILAKNMTLSGSPYKGMNFEDLKPSKLTFNTIHFTENFKTIDHSRSSFRLNLKYTTDEQDDEASAINKNKYFQLSFLSTYRFKKRRLFTDLEFYVKEFNKLNNLFNLRMRFNKSIDYRTQGGWKFSGDTYIRTQKKLLGTQNLFTRWSGFLKLDKKYTLNQKLFFNTNFEIFSSQYLGDKTFIQGSLDPSVFNQYNLDHIYGIRNTSYFEYAPFEDLKFRFTNILKSNEFNQNKLLDQNSFKFRTQFNYKLLSSRIEYQNISRFEDYNRTKSNESEYLKFDSDLLLKYSFHRALVPNFNFIYDLNSKEYRISLSMSWYILPNRGFSHFLSDKIKYKSHYDWLDYSTPVEHYHVE